jgi:hypothetical protein
MASWTNQETRALHHDINSPGPGSREAAEPATIFEHAIRMLEHIKAWIRWDDPHDIARKTAAAAAAIMKIGPRSKFTDRLSGLFLSEVKKNKWDYATLEHEYIKLKKTIFTDRTEFVVCSESIDEINRGYETYNETAIMCDILSFIVIHKPCCRLTQMAWLIPAIAAGVPALPLVCHAADELADFMNDPREPFKPDCTLVGNSWLHRLGVYLLHQCSAQRLPPNLALIRLMSLATPPPSHSVKSGKAVRYSKYMANPDPTYYRHEAPPDQAVGKALALELLGELDANRQGEYFRRVERAAAQYAASVVNGAAPSIKSIQRASGLSWADTSHLVGRPSFQRLVFEHQCRVLRHSAHADCPDCMAVARSLEVSEAPGSSIGSSGSSW